MPAFSTRGSTRGSTTGSKTARICQVLLLMSVCAASAADAVTVELPAAGDNTLIESPIGENSNGAGPSLFAGHVGKNGGATPLRRLVIRFDVAASISPGATIDSVRLRLTRTGGNMSPSILDLHALESDWGEGTSALDGGMGAPSTPGDATWIHTFFDTMLWTTPGGDFDPTASATSFTNDGGLLTWSSEAMVSDVQSWLDDSDGDFGWIVLGDEATSSSVIKLGSRENTTVSVRPMLSVTYMPEPQPAMAAIAAFSTLAAVARMRVRSSGRGSQSRS